MKITLNEKGQLVSETGEVLEVEGHERLFTQDQANKFASEAKKKIRNSLLKGDVENLPNDFLSTIREELEKEKQAEEKAKQEQVEKLISDLKTENMKYKKSLLEKESEFKSYKVKEEILKAAKDFIDPEDLVKSLIDKVEYTDSGFVFKMLVDGKTESLDLQKAAELVAQQKPHYVRATQNFGGPNERIPANRQSPGKKFTKDQIANMTPEQINKIFDENPDQFVL